MSDGVSETVVIQNESEPDDTESTESEAQTSDDGDTVVVVTNSGDDSPNEGTELAATVGGLVERVNQLEEKLAETAFTAEDAKVTANYAAEEAYDAVEEAAEAAEEAAEDTATDAATDDATDTASEPETDNPPQSVPWTHRRIRNPFSRD